MTLSRITATDLARSTVLLTPQLKFAGFARRVRDAFAALGLRLDYRPAYWYNLTDYSPLVAEDGVLVLPRGTALLSAPASSLNDYRVIPIDSPGFVLDIHAACRSHDDGIDEEVWAVLEALRQVVATTDPTILVGRAS